MRIWNEELNVFCSSHNALTGERHLKKKRSDYREHKKSKFDKVRATLNFICKLSRNFVRVVSNLILEITTFLAFITRLQHNIIIESICEITNNIAFKSELMAAPKTYQNYFFHFIASLLRALVVCEQSIAAEQKTLYNNNIGWEMYMNAILFSQLLLSKFNSKIVILRK